MLLEKEISKKYVVRDEDGSIMRYAGINLFPVLYDSKEEVEQHLDDLGLDPKEYPIFKISTTMKRV